MDLNQPFVFIEGIDVVIRRDLDKHKAILENCKNDLIAFKQARAHEIAKKKHYRKQIGGGKFNDEALRQGIVGIAVNIRHMSDKISHTEKRIEHNTHIVDTLQGQLDDYNLRKLMKEDFENASPN